MSVTISRADSAQSVNFPKNDLQAIESARSATNQLWHQFEIFFRDILKHQVEQGHFKKRYDIPGHTASEYRVVQNARYEGGHTLYSNQEKRAKSVEALSEALRTLGDLYDSIPDDYLRVWPLTIQKLDGLVLDEGVYQLVNEYLKTLPGNTSQKLIKEAKKNIETCRQALQNLNELPDKRESYIDLLFESFMTLLNSEGVHKLYESMASVYQDTEKTEKIAEALRKVTGVLANVYDTIPVQCLDAWQATLKQLDTLALDKSINTFAHEYLNTVPTKAYGALKQKIQTNLEACRKALDDIQEAHKATPSPIFEFFTRFLTIGTRFFEKLNVLLQSLIEKQSNLPTDKPDVASAA